MCMFGKYWVTEPRKYIITMKRVIHLYFDNIFFQNLVKHAKANKNHLPVFLLAKCFE